LSIDGREEPHGSSIPHHWREDSSTEAIVAVGVVKYPSQGNHFSAGRISMLAKVLVVGHNLAVDAQDPLKEVPYRVIPFYSCLQIIDLLDNANKSCLVKSLFEKL
jgi:hypothetical protein